MRRLDPLLVELDGAERECEARFEEVVGICESCGSDDVRVARDEAERLIVSGFFQEVLDRVKIDEVREGAEQAIQDELERSA